MYSPQRSNRAETRPDQTDMSAMGIRIRAHAALVAWQCDRIVGDGRGAQHSGVPGAAGQDPDPFDYTDDGRPVRRQFSSALAISRTVMSGCNGRRAALKSERAPWFAMRLLRTACRLFGRDAVIRATRRGSPVAASRPLASCAMRNSEGCAPIDTPKRDGRQDGSPRGDVDGGPLRGRALALIPPLHMGRQTLLGR